MAFRTPLQGLPHVAPPGRLAGPGGDRSYSLLGTLAVEGASRVSNSSTLQAEDRGQIFTKIQVCAQFAKVMVPPAPKLHQWCQPRAQLIPNSSAWTAKPLSRVHFQTTESTASKRLTKYEHLPLTGSQPANGVWAQSPNPTPFTSRRPPKWRRTFTPHSLPGK